MVGGRTIRLSSKLYEPTRSARVGDKQHMMRHLAFFEALAGLDDEGPLWQSLAAGLVTLRLFDSWITRGGTEPGGDQWSVQAVRQQVEQVAVSDPARSILSGIVDEIERPGPAEPVRIVPRLMAYGRALDFAGRWALAAELFESVLAHIDPMADADLAIAAQFRLAFCRRVLGQLDAAERDYAAAGRMAATVDDAGSVFRSQIGLAKVALARGNLPIAERMLDDVIVRTTAMDMRPVRAFALHDRATVAIMRNEHERGIAMLNEALPDISPASARDRVIADIALGFKELGVHSAARDAYLIVAATAEEQFSRWAATVSLMTLAGLDGMETAFEQYRRQLADQPLNPELAVQYQLSLGAGLRQFGRTAMAREALLQGIRMAEHHSFNVELFRLESELQALERGEQAERARTTVPPPSVEGVATALRSMREEALAQT